MGEFFSGLLEKVKGIFIKPEGGLNLVGLAATAGGAVIGGYALGGGWLGGLAGAAIGAVGSAVVSSFLPGSNQPAPNQTPAGGATAAAHTPGLQQELTMGGHGLPRNVGSNEHGI